MVVMMWGFCFWQLHCTEGNWDCLFECKLDVDAELSCQLVEILDGHVHGPGCGHEMVSGTLFDDVVLGDEMDYWVEKCDGRGWSFGDG